MDDEKRMAPKPTSISFSALLKAKKQLDNAIATAKSDLEITGAIKCFEYSYELAWKTMKKVLEGMGLLDINNPRIVFNESFKNNLIDDLDAWLEFIATRNLTTHTYDEHLAREVFQMLPSFSAHLQLFIDKVQRPLPS